MLTHEGWAASSSTSIFDLMQQLRTQLVDDGAVVDPRNFTSARDRSAPLAYSIGAQCSIYNPGSITLGL